MRRRFGAIAAILCILVVGVSVTAATSQFVSSKGIDTVAILGVDPEGERAPETVANISLSMEFPEAERRLGRMGAFPDEAAFDAAKPEQEAGVGMGAFAPSAPGNQEKMNVGRDAAKKTETFMETAPLDGEIPAAESAKAPAGSTEGNGGVYDSPAESFAAESFAKESGRSEALAAETFAVPAADGPSAGLKAVPAPAAAMAPGEEVGPGAFASEEESQSPVRSPLETAPQETESAETAKAASEAGESSGPSAADLRARLQSVEEQLSERDSASSGVFDPHPAQEKLNLWNEEMNVIADTLWDKMDSEEAESFKMEQLEWLRDSDKAAQGAAKSDSSGSNEEYIEKHAELTRKRCYEMVEKYEETLDR